MTIFSLVAIAHRWGGASRGEQVSKALFGSPGAGLRHDFPSHLDEFSRRTEWAYGQPDDLAINATVLPYFLRFRPPEVQVEALALMSGRTVEPLKFVLGLPAGPSGASMPLCSCEECIREDIEAHGFAYWHRRHQLPGVFVCPTHGHPLRRSNIRINGRGRSMLFLPNDEEIVATNTTGTSDLQQPMLQRISIMSASALDVPLPGGYSPQVLLATYQHGLKQQGLLTKSGRVRATDFVKWLSDRYRSVADIDMFDRIINQSNMDGMLRLVRKPRWNFHSIYHLLLIDALFGSWERFLSVYSWEHQMGLPLLGQDKERQANQLPATNPLRGKDVANRRPRVDWAARDYECSNALKAIEETISFEDWERVKPMVVLRKIHTLSFSPRLERLPESRALVSKIIARAKGLREKH